MYLKSLGFFAVLGLSSAAHSQIAQVSQFVDNAHVVFAGVVTNDVTKTVQIYQNTTDPTTGAVTRTLVPYTGLVTPYPVQQGDTVALSYDVQVPSPQAIAQGNLKSYLGTDGLYHFTPNPAVAPGSSPVQLAGPGQIVVTHPDGTVSTPQPTSLLRGISITYNPTSGAYGLASTGSSGWQALTPSLPTYNVEYGANGQPDGKLTGVFNSNGGFSQPGSSTNMSADCQQFGLCTSPAISGTDTSAVIGSPNIPFFSNPEGLGAQIAGFFSGIDLSGLFNFGSFAGSPSSNGATDVPEPGAVGLFLSGVAGLWLVRRRRTIRAQV